MPLSKGFSSNYRIVLLAGGLFACFGALGVRLVWVHIIERDALLKGIEKVRPMLVPEAARRGDILDVRGARLATSRSEIVLGVDPHALRPSDERKWPELAALLEMPEAELRQHFTPRFREEAVPARAPEAPLVSFRIGGAAKEGGADASGVEVAKDTAEEKTARPVSWVKLRENVPESLYEKIRSLGVHGVYPQREYRRVYPSNQLAAHVIGYVNRQQAGVAGIEAHMDFYLRGQQGWRLGERDGRNRELPQFGTREVPRVDGYSVKLSIDLTVQDIVEQELAYIAERFEPKKASIIVSDVDGFVLAMANYPTFNLNESNKVPKGEEARMKNAAVTDIYDPGSVFKIVPAAAAIEEGLVTPNSVLDCTLDSVAYRGRTLSLPSEDHKMGNLTVAEIISHSSNKGAAQLGIMLGEEKLHRYARAFGFGARLGFPAGGEVAGLLHPHKQWSSADFTRIPMGHGISSTVLQMHEAMLAVAAGGVLLRPQVVREIRDSNNEIVFRYDRMEIGRAVSAETAQKVARMLVGVTRQGGTAMEAAIEGFEVSGKTGTSQKFVDGAWSKKHHVASFVGFFPAMRPQVVISVVVDDADHKAPGGVAYGRTVAAPSFRRIGERLIPHLEIKTDSAGLRPNLIAWRDRGTP